MKRCLLFCLMVIIIFASGCATTGGVKDVSNPEAKPVITGIDIQDYSVAVKADKPFTYTLYRSTDPYRIIVELLNVNIGAFNRKVVSEKAGVTEITPSQVSTPTYMARLELLLQAPFVVEPEYKENTLTIKMVGRMKEEPVKEALKEAEEEEEVEEEIAEEEEVALPVAELAPPVAELAPLPKATEINSISFERVADTLKVLIKGNGSMTPNVFALDNRIVLDVPDVAMKAQIPSAVVAPLKGIRSGKYNDKTRLVLDLKEKVDFNVTAINDSIIVAFVLPTPIPKKPEEVRVPEVTPVVEGKYTGKKISLDFQDADIGPIFRLLSDISGYNIVVSPDVKGRLTMKLINVPWDQALDIIVKTFSLGKSVEGNIIRIAPLAAFAKESEDAAKAKEAELKAESLETRVFPISYADVTSLEKAIKDSKTLTARGSISLDKRTSSLLVKDVPAVFSQVENLLKTLDKQTPQVLIEARIVEVSTSSARDLGIQWGFFSDKSTGLASFSGFPALGIGPFTGRNFLIDFPAPVAAGAGSGFSFGILNSQGTAGLDLQISALETLDKAKIISNPRIVTSDNEKAFIMQGTSEPYPKIDVQSGQVSADYKDVVISTEVTPHITPAGAISMSILVKKEDILEFTTIGGNPVPRTSKIEGNTKVLIQDGETLVIGGVYRRTERETTVGVPGLMHIPILGWLFKSRGVTDDVTELLIFITPRAVEKPL